MKNQLFIMCLALCTTAVIKPMGGAAQQQRQFNVNQQDRHGNTLLHTLINDFVELLDEDRGLANFVLEQFISCVRQGGTASIPNFNGQTPFDLYLQHTDNEINDIGTLLHNLIDALHKEEDPKAQQFLISAIIQFIKNNNPAVDIQNNDELQSPIEALVELPKPILIKFAFFLINALRNKSDSNEKLSRLKKTLLELVRNGLNMDARTTINDKEVTLMQIAQEVESKNEYVKGLVDEIKLLLQTPEEQAQIENLIALAMLRNDPQLLKEMIEKVIGFKEKGGGQQQAAPQEGSAAEAQPQPPVIPALPRIVGRQRPRVAEPRRRITMPRFRLPGRPVEDPAAGRGVAGQIGS